MTLEILAAALGLFAAMRKNKSVSGCRRIGNIPFYNSALAMENDGNGDDEFTTMLLSDVKDKYFKLKPTDSAPVWVKGDYDRSLRAYECYTFDGDRERYISGKTIVYAGFWF